ncbi:MAG: dihydropteroate synthase [Beggiatoa sp. IS2]|nr:MAG: dihydropteroate synthase [Beggiatoa sp. IS2]
MFENFTQIPPQVMGILNVTPDSFSDGGHYFSLEKAFDRARQIIAEGADIIDIGGESTRPNAQTISVQAELERVIPILEKIRAEWPLCISVDTSQPEVMREAIVQGAHLINDVRALQREGCLQIVASSKTVGVCLMHMQGEPNTMQKNPCYHDVVGEVKDFLQTRIQACLTAGIAPSRLCIDPGIGFGKTTTHNLLLVKYLSHLTQLGYPVLVGFSRKSLIGQILNKPVTDRLYGGLALAVLAVHQGAKIIRTHDVAATVDALRMIDAVLRPS